MLQKRSVEHTASIIFLIISACCFICHFIFFRYSFPLVNLDEASFFSPATSFAKKGILSSEIHKSFLPGASQYTYWMPPFYMVFLGSILKITGITVYNAKLVSFILISASAFLISLISTDKYIKICVSSLLLICPFIIITSAFIRMEALSVFLITLCIVAIQFHWKSYIIGILGGVLIMTHPLLMACGAGLAVMMAKRGLKPFIIFSIFVLLTISPYIFYIFQDVALFRDQMALQFLRKSKAKIADLKVAYILQSVPMSLLAFFCLWKIRYASDMKLFLSISLVLSLLIVLKSNEFNYQVYLVPYVVAAIGVAMEEKKRLFQYQYILPLSVYLFFVMILFSKAKKYNFQNDGSYNELVSYLNNNTSWSGRDIYVQGIPDLSTFLIEKNQQVERQNAVATSKSNTWQLKYNYVIEVTDNLNAENNIDSTITRSAPWKTWSDQHIFTTRNGSHTLRLFAK